MAAVGPGRSGHGGPGRSGHDVTDAARAVRARCVLVGVMLAVMWGLEILDLLPGHELRPLGHPAAHDRAASSASRLAPFLHSGLVHLVANTLPFAVLGAFIAIGDAKRFVEVTVDRRPDERPRDVAVRRAGHDPHRRQRPRVRVPDVPRGARLLRRQAAVDPRRRRRAAVLRRDPVGPAPAARHLLHRPPVRRRRRRRSPPGTSTVASPTTPTCPAPPRPDAPDTLGR